MDRKGKKKMGICAGNSISCCHRTVFARKPQTHDLAYGLSLLFLLTFSFIEGLEREQEYPRELLVKKLGLEGKVYFDEPAELLASSPQFSEVPALSP
jgi:hypothetical protein